MEKIIQLTKLKSVPVVQTETEWSVTLNLTTGQSIVFGKTGEFTDEMVDEVKNELATALIDLYGVDLK
jgi:hypothetical protein